MKFPHLQNLQCYAVASEISSKSFLSIQDGIISKTRLQTKVFRLITNTNITNQVDTLKYRGKVGAVALFYRYFRGQCSSEI